LTPSEIDSDVERIIQKINTGTRPIFLDVVPEPYARVVECFPAVEEKIRRDGGMQQIGWQIWKSDILVEAEFHAVWCSPDGCFFDITPKQVLINRILFLPDPNATYRGCQVDNIRLNTTDNRLVDDFIKIAEAIFRLENKGERAMQHQIKLSEQESQLHQALHQTKTAIYLMLRSGLSRNSLCFCQSGRRYKRCHGEGLVDMLDRI
jgi:hypothetical protein